MNIITWNVQWFCGLDGRIDIPRVVAAARDMADFDVLCLQEVAINYPRLEGNAGHDQPAILKSLLPDFEICFGAAVDELAADGKSRQRFGNLIASRLPVSQIHHYALPYPADATSCGVRSMPRIGASAVVQTPLGPVRFMTTHLEYYSPAMRLAQARELRRLHEQACALAASPPMQDDSGSPFQSKVHTPHCVLTGDFNFEPHSEEYQLLQDGPPALALRDAWRIASGSKPHPPTFRLYDRRYGPEPIACDFLFVSQSLTDRVRRFIVNSATQASDHQPVLLELA